jgi:hypothetical protein
MKLMKAFQRRKLEKPEIQNKKNKNVPLFSLHILPISEKDQDLLLLILSIYHILYDLAIT